ncbi:MAG: isochorismatase family cysteine hydrolase [Hyphomicrobium sp.]|uniref:cysteine hydrolase family protein n=1 Tax=Hyphomicrobium sp. TaxID=82 RepID=UPI0039E408A6
MEPFYRPIPAGKVGTQNTALLVIDMERDFVDGGAVQETPGGRAIVPAINRLIGWARQHALPVIFTHEMHRADHSDYGIELEFDPVHCLEGTPGCELTDGLDVRPEDWRIRNKRRYDCFVGTDLDLLLRSRGIKNLVCCGVTTHCCVMSTVYSARNLDYRVIVPTDAVAAVSPAHQAAALLCMSDVFAYLSSTAAIASWPIAAGTFETGTAVQSRHAVA